MAIHAQIKQSLVLFILNKMQDKTIFNVSLNDFRVFFLLQQGSQCKSPIRGVFKSCSFFKFFGAPGRGRKISFPLPKSQLSL